MAMVPATLEIPWFILNGRTNRHVIQGVIGVIGKNVFAALNDKSGNRAVDDVVLKIPTANILKEIGHGQRRLLISERNIDVAAANISDL